MSESEEDFGGFGSPIPSRPKPVAPSAKPGSSRTQAGPSRAAAGGAARRKPTATDSDIEEAQPPPAKKTKATRGRKQQEPEQEQEAEEGHTVDHHADDPEADDGDIQEIEPPRPKMKGRLASKKPPSHSTGVVNGNAGNALASAAAKGKGKVKAKPAPKARQPSIEEVDMELVEQVDEEMDVDVNEGEEGVSAVVAKPAARGTKSIKPPPKPPSKQDAEIARLQEALKQADSHIADMKRQLTELSTVRHTEPEQLLERMENQHKNTLRAQDALIADLKAKLAQSDPLLRSGKKAVFEILTREEANREMEKLNNQLKAYKEALGERDRSLTEKEEQIKTLEQEKSDLKFELKVEIDRSATLAAKSQRPPMGSAPRSNGGLIASHQDPKMTQIVKFYEDLSNLLVPSVRVQPGRYLKTDEWILSCCYIYKDVTNPEAESRSIVFSLRLCWDLKPGSEEPVTSFDQLVESVHYIPHELEKETPEFIASLGFLGDTFTFERDQLSLFLRTLYDYISGEGNDKGSQEGDSDDGSIEVLQ